MCSGGQRSLEILTPGGRWCNQWRQPEWWFSVSVRNLSIKLFSRIEATVNEKQRRPGLQRKEKILVTSSCLTPATVDNLFNAFSICSYSKFLLIKTAAMVFVCTKCRKNLQLNRHSGSRFYVILTFFAPNNANHFCINYYLHYITHADVQHEVFCKRQDHNIPAVHMQLLFTPW